MLGGVLDAEDAIDAATFSGEVEKSKPAPDLADAALQKIGASAGDAVFVGDTVWDTQACRKAGVICVVVLSGGFSRDELTSAGAAEVYRDPGELLASLPQSLLARLCQLGTGRTAPSAVCSAASSASEATAALCCCTQSKRPDPSRTEPAWSPFTESNRRPSPYHGDALPTELKGRVFSCPPQRYSVKPSRRREVPEPLSTSVSLPYFGRSDGWPRGSASRPE